MRHLLRPTLHKAAVTGHQVAATILKLDAGAGHESRSGMSAGQLDKAINERELREKNAETKAKGIDTSLVKESASLPAQTNDLKKAMNTFWEKGTSPSLSKEPEPASLQAQIDEIKAKGTDISPAKEEPEPASLQAQIDDLKKAMDTLSAKMKSDMAGVKAHVRESTYPLRAQASHDADETYTMLLLSILNYACSWPGARFESYREVYKVLQRVIHTLETGQQARHHNDTWDRESLGKMFNMKPSELLKVLKHLEGYLTPRTIQYVRTREHPGRLPPHFISRCWALAEFEHMNLDDREVPRLCYRAALEAVNLELDDAEGWLGMLRYDVWGLEKHKLK